MSNFLNYIHFPIYSVMVLFLGAFLIVVLGRSKLLRNVIAVLSAFLSLACMIALIKPVMINGEVIAYWMGSRVPAGGYAIGIAMEVDALSLFCQNLNAVGRAAAEAEWVSCSQGIFSTCLSWWKSSPLRQ